MLSPANSLPTSGSILNNETIQARANWGNQGKLWSTLAEIGEFLHIPVSPAMHAETTLFQHVHYKAGQRIHTLGQEFDTLYLVNCGFLKTVLLDEFGHEQVLHFPMKGDVLGIDSIHVGHHSSEAIALSDCDVILIPYKSMVVLSRQHEELEHALFSLMSRELAREQTMVTMLGALSAEARVSRFLLSLSERFSCLGYSRNVFNLRMTRNEIGSYLGLTLETVSRTLSALNELGLISVNQRRICINDASALKSLRKLPSNKAKEKLTECLQSSGIANWGLTPVLN